MKFPKRDALFSKKFPKRDAPFSKKIAKRDTPLPKKNWRGVPFYKNFRK